MSVIGIDFGNESCYVGAAKAGGIETLANDYSLRATPSCVAFDGKKRILGVAAKNQQVTNMKNTVSGFKRLLGRNFSDPHVQRELNHIPVKVEKRHDGKVGICVNYLGQQQQFTPEQLTAMLLTKIKETSASALQAQVNDCVITCPVYFTNAERKALLDAAQIAGLNVLRLMNETTATALSYGFYKQDLPDDKPRNVVFVDCGQASLQVSACAFTKGKLRMLASTWEHIGGRDFDNALAEHFNEEFIKRYKINAKTDARALLRLLAEIEKLKKQMSANSTKLPLNIECLMNEVDVTSSMQRAQMEELCAPLFARVEQTFRALLQQSKLSLQDIHSVEIVGGSSRIPMIKHLIEQVFGKPASTTLNQDESVARGAALQCAIMSPAVRVRDFSVTDIQSYEVKLNWEDEGKFNTLTVFPLFHAAPFSRLITFKRKDPFTLTLQYAEPYPCPDPVIGKWHVKNLKTGGEPKEVEVKVRINAHGLVMIMSAVVIERIEAEEAAAAENISAGNGEQHTEGSTDGPEAEKKKKLTKAIELEIDCQMPGFSAGELQNLIQQEAVMVGNDAKETERIDAKNALEEFVYDMRNKLQGGPLSQYVVEKERDEICNNLNDVENWLYEDGEDCERDVYASKLNSFIARTDPIRERAQNFENCPLAFQDLQHAINFAHYAHDEYKRGVEKYNHLTEAEFVNIGEAAEKARRYLENSMPRFSQASRTKDCPIKLSEVEQEKNTLNNVIYTVLNRPKPKVTENNGATDKNNMQTDNNTDDAKAEEQKQAAAADSTMDVD